MKLYSWNINGIRAVHKKGALKEFIKKEKPDILCLQETKGYEEALEKEFPEYEKFWNTGGRKGYSGTAIWSKVPALSASYGMPEALITEYELDSDPYGNPSNEGRVILLEYERFYLLTVYTPNSKRDLTRLPLRSEKWDPAFLKYIVRRNEKKPVIFTGDLNVAHTEIDLANPKANKGKHGFTDEERAGFDNFLEAGFVDTFRLFNQDGGNYTWWTHWANARERNVGWRIDYIMASTDCEKYVKDAAIHPEIMGSDHCPVSVTLDFETAK